MAKSKPPSQRQLRVGELIRHELAQIFGRGDTHDAVIDRAGVTVLEVQASPDLKIATVYVRPLLDGDADGLMQALQKNRRRIRGLLSPRLTLKFMPDLRFKLDTALDYAGHIDDILRDPKVARDLAKAPDGDASEG